VSIGGAIRVGHGASASVSGVVRHGLGLSGGGEISRHSLGLPLNWPTLHSTAPPLLTMNARTEDTLATCLRAYPSRPQIGAAEIDAAFWDRAERGGVAVAIAQQLSVRTPRVDALRLSQMVSGMRSQAVTERVLRVCEQLGIPAAPLKGALLAERLYGDIALRPTSDVDVLVPERDVARLVVQLAAEGADVPEPHVHAFYAKHHHHLNVEWLNVLVELHFRATSNFGVFTPAEPLLQRATDVRVGAAAVTARRLEPNDELVYLATHAAAHFCAHDILLVDLKLFEQRHALDWKVVEARARSLRLQRAVGMALIAAERRAGLETSGMSDAWRAASRKLLARIPPDLPPGYVDDWRVRMRAHIAHARLCASGALAARVLARDMVRAAKRRIWAWLPGAAPREWEV
jgi:hypothetical protein